MKSVKFWERQEKESTKAYEAFVIYRDLGVGRTFKAVAEKLHKSYTIIRRWKEQWNWEKRATDWDNFIVEKASKKAAEDYAKMLELQINLGKMFQAKGATALQNMDFENVPMKFLPSIIELINSGVKIERTARELGKEVSGEGEQAEDVIIQIPAKNERL